MPVKELFEDLRSAVIVGDVRKARRIAEQVINRGLSVNLALQKLIEAMEIVDKRYERKEYFIVDVAAAASAMREAFRVLEPHLQVEPAGIKGKIVIGSLKGNPHGIGKDIVAATLRAAGFHVVNLGVNVPPEKFVESALKEDAEVIAVSVTLGETVQYLGDLVNILREKGLKDKIKVIIGGRAVSEETCKEYGLDAYAKDAWDCVKKVKALLGS
ncbi:cobalamin-dependent protein [Candidatus Bathyarchaeota archaeon]|nr:cobalamin-dependent protein [Candidatus Bathyarchaeota archaeon]